MIKNKNIDPTASFPTQIVYLHTCATATTTANIDVWVAPWAGKILYATLSSQASTSATGAIDVVIATQATNATQVTSVFTAAGTMAGTQQVVLDASSLLTTSAANGGVAFASGAIIALQTKNAVLTKPTAAIMVRPLLAKELSGY